jgi:mannose-6-phosphate isomerase-like protein (cupin superfamily)
MKKTWEPIRLSEAPDTVAPDGSLIRLLPRLKRGSMVHCSLPPGQVTRAVRHRTVEELWYVVGGEGQLWRRGTNTEEVVELSAGLATTIPLGVEFQFRATGTEPLEVIIVTMPPWPGESEAVAGTGIWESTVP